MTISRKNRSHYCATAAKVKNSHEQEKESSKDSSKKNQDSSDASNARRIDFTLPQLKKK